MKKENIDCIKLYNSYQENSWQRFALQEERKGYIMQGIDIDFYKDIESLLKSINDFELNPDTEVTREDYEDSKIKYNEYIQLFQLLNQM